MYAREIDGKVYDFGVSGKLIMNVLVMYDRQTESYWSQLLGEAVEGELQGTELEFVSSWFTSWSAWVAEHPNTIALDKGSNRSTDSYTGYYTNGQAGIIGEAIDDDRLDTKDFIIGVEHEGSAKAYPFSALSRESIVNDTLNDLDLVVVFVREGSTGIVFERQLDELTLTFQHDETTGQMIDEETGTLWDIWRGIGLEGELEGHVLRRVPSTRSFWFGWKDWYPDTAVFERG